jgi:LacI family transcriptional regulator
VQQSIAELAFVQNGNARALAGSRSATIGLVVTGLDHSYSVEIAGGAQAEAARVDKHLLLANTDNQLRFQDEHLDFFDQARVAGILLAPMRDSHAAIERMRSHGRPVVLINYHEEHEGTCTILVDNERVGAIAAEHMLDLGRRRVALVAGGDDHLQPILERRRGVHAVLDATDRSVAFEEIDADVLSAAEGERVAREIAARPESDRPDAVIAGTDLVAATLIRELLLLGVDVPGDVAVMGMDANSFTWGGSVPLTTVYTRGHDLGAEGIRLLLEEIETGPEGHEHRSVVLQPELLPRESTLGRGKPSTPGRR